MMKPGYLGSRLRYAYYSSELPPSQNLHVRVLPVIYVVANEVTLSERALCADQTSISARVRQPEFEENVEEGHTKFYAGL